MFKILLLILTNLALWLLGILASFKMSQYYNAGIDYISGPSVLSTAVFLAALSSITVLSVIYVKKEIKL